MVVTDEAAAFELKRAQIAHARGSLRSDGLRLAMDLDRLVSRPGVTDDTIFLAWSALHAVQSLIWLLESSDAEQYQIALRRAKLEGLAEGWAAADEIRARAAAVVEAIKQAQEPIIKRLMDDRALARAARKFGLADSLREELRRLGVEVADGPDGSTWRYRDGWGDALDPTADQLINPAAPAAAAPGGR